MKDVIFAGCDTRGRSKFAEVTLEFDNSKGYIKNYEGTTLKVGRRAEIDGKSSYFINDQQARLKDIQDIFLDTGIGNDSYSMIGQEQTKKLLSSKLEDRRAIFEEASGIVRLKNQKEETEKSLVEIEQNFVRLNDILKELKRQLAPLKKQKEKADVYVNLSSQLKEIEVGFLSKKAQLLSAEIQLFTNEKTELINLFQEVESELSSIELKVQGLKTNNKEQNEHLFSLQESKSKLEQALVVIEKQLENLEERNRNFNAQMFSLTEEIEEITAKSNVSFGEIQKKQERLEFIESSTETIVANIEEKERLLALNGSTSQNNKENIEKKRKELVELFNVFNEAKINFEQQRLAEEKIMKEIFSIQNDSAVSSVERIENELQEMRSQAFESERKLTSLLNNLSSAEAQKELFTEQIRETENLIFQNESNKKTKNTLLAQLEQSNDNKDFLFNSVKKILAHKQEFEGIVDIVSNLMKPKKDFEISVDSLLGNMSQFFVLTDFVYAKPIIHFLKKNNYGSASFLSLKDAKPKRFSDQELQKIRQTEGIFYTPDHIEFDSKYEQIVQQIFGRTLIANDLDTAIQFSKSVSFSFKASTKEGEIVQPGMVSGGSKNKKGAFALQKEIDSLTSDIQTIENDLVTLSEKKLSLQEHQKLNLEDVASLKAQVLAAEKSKNESSLLVERRKTELENAQENSKEKSLRLAELQQEFNQLKKASSHNYDLYEQKKNLYEQEEGLLDRLIADQETLEQDLVTERDALYELKNRIATQEEEKKSLTAFLNEYKNGNEDMSRKLLVLEEKRRNAESEHDQTTAEMDELIEELREKQESLRTVSAELEEKKDLYKMDTSELEECETRFSTLLKEKERSVERQHELDLSLTNLSNKFNVITKRALEAYEMTEEILLAYVTDEIDLVSAEKIITRLRGEIKALGSVNLDSIKDFLELDNRYQTENAQFEDVKAAKEDLEFFLRNIRDEMKERFTTTFKEIASYFEEAFTDLFGGGRAKLSLEDPRNPLTSHIKIMAQPPGKKPNSIESLSGGEKSMTVSALIFAIIKAKPSPFVYLDEIDAPLDDANVSRFAFYLKKSSENSQFIVVTHRKGTMMASDSLYGVTQEEPGITIVFPHKLETIQKEA